MLKSLLKIIGFDTNPIQAIDSTALGFTWGWAGLCLFLLVLMPLFYFAYQFEGKNVSSKDRMRILALRGVFVFVLLSLLAGLNIVVTGWVPQKNKLAILVDNSKSMTIKVGEKTRFEQVKELLVKDKFIEKLQSNIGIAPDVFGFSDTVSPVSQVEIKQFSMKPTGNQTNLSGAIKDISGNLGSGNMLGIIALTDGSQTTGESLRNVVSNMRTPLYFIAPEGGKTRDMAISLTRPPSIGYLNSSLRIRGELKLHNIATSTAKVVVEKNGKLFQTVDVPIKDANIKTPFSFNINCNEEGSDKYSVSIPIVKNELTEDNNQTGFLLKVVKERLNILVIAEKPSWDLKFLRIALGTDPNANLNSWIKVNENRWSRTKNSKVINAVYKPDFMTDIENADVLILRGVSVINLQPYVDTIMARLENGRLGVMILPSDRNFQALGYNGTKLARLLPVSITNEKWRGIAGNMLLTSGDVSYNFLHLIDDPIENMDFFRTLPKFDGIYEYAGKKPSAEVLITSTVHGPSGPLPFLLRQPVGQGNVVMFCGGPIWPMGFRLLSSEHGFQPYSAFTINLLKWLANRRENAQVSIDIPSARGYTGQQTPIRIWVMNSKHQLQTGALVSMTAEGKDKKPFDLFCVETSEKGCYETSFIPALQGLYNFKAKASYQGKTIGKSEAKLLVETPTAEFDDPDIKISFMKQLASDTGGVYLPISSAQKLFTLIKPKAGKKQETKIFEARNSFVILLLLLLLPIVEWTYRRIRGLS